VPGNDRIAVYVQDVTDRRRHEQTVNRLRDERKRAAVINDLLSDILEELVGASSRGEIAEMICERLGETSLYEFAWVGERDLGDAHLTVRAAAGNTGETFDAVRKALDDNATTPEERAVEEGRPQIVQPLPEESTAPEGIRMAAFADGIHSMVAIPLHYGSNVYGVVGVYAEGQDAFSNRERSSFETLGEIAGFAVNAVRNRSLLLSDTITEVTFNVREGSALAAVTGDLDVEMNLEGLVPHCEGRLLCYIAVEGSVEAVADALAEEQGVTDVRLIGETDSRGSFEVEFQASTPLLAVANLGATVQTAAFEDGVGQVVVELPPDEDVHRMANALTREYDADIAAKRERERSVTTAREYRDELGSRLTDRQETVLRTAYHANYFESPRGSTAEEVADSLDITGSTLLHHLRASQRKLLDAFYETESYLTD
jgi:predicted DNA binding protein